MRVRSSRPSRSYAAIPNAAMRDSSISIEARGLLALLMTYADDWEFSVDHIRSLCGVGRDKIRAMLRELDTAGYLIRKTLQGDDGRLLGSSWVINDEPETTSSGVQASGARQDVADAGTNRPPEKPVIGATDPLKNRPPEKPTAGKSVPIRRTISKNTNIQERRACSDEEFDRFMGAYPQPVEPDAARKAFLEIVEAGEADPALLIAAAGRYSGCGEVARGFSMKPANWLRRGAWRQWALAAGPPPPMGPEASLTSLRSFADAVRARRNYAASSVSPPMARLMLEHGFVTKNDLKAAGVSW